MHISWQQQREVISIMMTERIRFFGNHVLVLNICMADRHFYEVSMKEEKLMQKSAAWTFVIIALGEFQD